jgi:glycosyltransferase involved in cell wall biosynthesis
LILIGGVDERGMKYFKEIEKKVSENQLKIELAPNITNINKESILKRATYYWHAGGMGVSHDRPQDMEHFGISVIESIHAGLIPLVFNAAGPAEILNDFPDLRFDNLTQLAEVTHELSCSDSTQITESIAELPLNYDLLTFQKKVFSLLNEIN